MFANLNNIYLAVLNVPDVAWGVLQTALIVFNLGSSYLPKEGPAQH